MVATSLEKVKKSKGPQVGDVPKKKRKLLFTSSFMTKKAKVHSLIHPKIT